MRDDLQGLEITRKELQSLTNLPVNEELIFIVNPIKKGVRSFIKKLRGSEGMTVFFIGFSTLFLTYTVFDFVIQVFELGQTISSWILLVLFCFLLGGLIQSILFIFWKKKTHIVKSKITNSLKILLEDVERYNAVIKAIDINDQIESAGNKDVSIKERKRILEALRFTRADLVRALMTERILRENKRFILNNTELFANNLTNLIALQVTEQATEHGRLLNEALQIALDVQHEMGRLQNR